MTDYNLLFWKKGKCHIIEGKPREVISETLDKMGRLQRGRVFTYHLQEFYIMEKKSYGTYVEIHFMKKGAKQK